MWYVLSVYPAPLYPVCLVTLITCCSNELSSILIRGSLPVIISRGSRALLREQVLIPACQDVCHKPHSCGPPHFAALKGFSRAIYEGNAEEFVLGVSFSFIILHELIWSPWIFVRFVFTWLLPSLEEDMCVGIVSTSTSVCCFFFFGLSSIKKIYNDAKLWTQHWYSSYMYM